MFSSVHVQFTFFATTTLCSPYVHVQFTFSSHPQRRSPRGNASHVHTITHRKPKQRTGVPHKRISTVTKPYLYHCKCIATQVTATHPFALHSWIEYRCCCPGPRPDNECNEFGSPLSKASPVLPGPSLGTTVSQASTSGDYAGDLDTPGVNHVAIVAPPTPAPGGNP